MQILLRLTVWNIPHEHDLPNEVAVNTTDSHRQRSLWFSSPCVQKLHESLLKCRLPTTVVTGDQTKCISDPLKPKKQNAICTLEPQETTSPVASVMNIIKDKHQCKRKKKKKRIDKLWATFFSRSKDAKAKFHYQSDRARSAKLIYFPLSSFQSPLDKQKEEPHSQESISPSERQRNHTGDRKTSQMAPAVSFDVCICAETVALRLCQHEVEQNKSIVARESLAFCTNLHQKKELEASGQTEPSNPAFKHICNTLKSMYIKQPPPLPSTTLPQSPDSRCVTPVDRRWGRGRNQGWDKRSVTSSDSTSVGRWQKYFDGLNGTLWWGRGAYLGICEQDSVTRDARRRGVSGRRLHLPPHHCRRPLPNPHFFCKPLQISLL